jgi:hypothetical protein
LRPAAGRRGRRRAASTCRCSTPPRQRLNRADRTDYPNIDRARDEQFSGTSQQRLRWAFSVLIDGIAATGIPAPR